MSDRETNESGLRSLLGTLDGDGVPTRRSGPDERPTDCAGSTHPGTPAPGSLRGLWWRLQRLPPGLPPRCLSRAQAAAYLGIGDDIFGQLIAQNLFPPPLAFKRRRVWDRVALDRCLDWLSGLLDRDGPDGSVGRRAESPSPARQALLEAIRGPK